MSETGLYTRCQAYFDDFEYSDPYFAQWSAQTGPCSSDVHVYGDARREFEYHTSSPNMETLGKELRRYQCNYCDRRFDKRADIARHEASVHRDKLDSPPPLSYCPYPECTRKDRGFTRADNFREHMRRVHGEIQHKGR